MVAQSDTMYILSLYLQPLSGNTKMTKVLQDVFNVLYKYTMLMDLDTLYVLMHLEQSC